MLTGHLDDEMEISLDKKVIYVYHCAYHTDSVAEREELQRLVYPWLHEHCREQGACLEVIDLSWNLKDFYAYGHVARRLPAAILKELMNQSDRSIFTIMLNEKYACYWIPLEIDEADFQLIMKKVTEDEKEFLNQWYKLNDVLEPPSYVLQSVESRCEKYRCDGSGGLEVFREGLRTWEKQHLRLSNIMSKTAPAARHKLAQTSDIELDLNETLLSAACEEKNMILIQRKLINMHLDDAMRYPQLEHFIDVTGGHLNELAQAKLKNMASRVLQRIDEDRHIELSVPWLAMVSLHPEVEQNLQDTDRKRVSSSDAPFNANNLAFEKCQSMPEGYVDKNELIETWTETVDEKGRRRSCPVYKRRKNAAPVRTNEGAHPETMSVGSSMHNDVEENEQDRKNYLTNLTVTYRIMIKEVIDGIFENIAAQKSKRQIMIDRGLTESLISDIEHHSKFAMENRFSVLGQNEFVQQLENTVVKSSSVGPLHPLMVHGSAGSGKTALMSVLAANIYSFDKWKNCISIGRFAGVSKNCITLEETVYSIAQQLCVLLDLPINTVTKHKTKILHHLLQPSVIGCLSLNIIIILDGLAMFETSAEWQHFSWLPRTLPTSVRFVLTATTGSVAHLQYNDYMGKDANSLELPRLFRADQLSLLGHFLQRYKRSISETMQQKLFQHMSANISPLHLKILTVCLVHYGGEGNILNVLGRAKDLNEAINVLLSYLEKQFGVEYVALFCSVLVCARCGISQKEFLDLASSHAGVCSENFINSGTGSTRVSCLQWYAITSALHDFLHFHVSHGYHLCCWRHAAFVQACRERYKEGLNDTSRLLAEYWTSQLSKDSARHVHAQPIRFSNNTYNGRVLDELVYALHDNHSKLLHDFFDASFIQGLVQLCSTTEALHQLSLFPLSDDICCICTIIEHLEHVLISNKQAFLTHLYQYVIYNKITTQGKYPVLEKLFLIVKEQLPELLSPICSLGTFTFGYTETEPSCEYTNTGIFRIKGDDEHMIITALMNNEVKIFNFHTGLNHRVFTNLELPRDVRVITMFRAVILCDRQLNIYDLDKGCLFSSLHGVLNLRMPFFGVHDTDHTMAMSRNRMYVNMLHNSTGQVVTTFKVGEDRFLNSLLVSDNGEICVCGDDVQKPFPLLVWNLKHRKLIHDFRIRGHEFLTRMAAITKDGQYVVVVCREVEYPEPNFLIAYDLQSGIVFTKIKPSRSCTSVAISREAELIVSAHEDGTVAVWNLQDSAVAHSPKFVLHGHTSGVDQLLLSDNGKRGITYDSKGRDPFIWMWQFTDGVPLGCIPSTYGPSSCQISADGNAVLAAWPDQDLVLTFHVPGETFVSNIHAVYGDSARKGKIISMNKL